MARLSFGKKRRRRKVNYDLLHEIFRWGIQIIFVCVLAFACVWYFGIKVNVIGDSMNPNLQNGDTVLINRLVYDVRKPERGEIIAFGSKGTKESNYYIKRVIGLPGETIAFENGDILIDGEKIEEDYKTTEIEELGVFAEPITLREDEFFVLGDDRTIAEDSRNVNAGNIKRTEIKGKVWFVTSPKEHFGFVK